MSFEENRNRLNAFMQTLDEGDESKALALIDDLFAEDYVLHTGGSTVAHHVDVLGRQGLREATLGSFRTFSNMQHIIADEFGDDQKLATRIRFLAVLKGDFLGVSGSDQAIDCPIIYLHRFHNGKIQECWTDWESLWSVAARLAATPRQQPA